MFCLNMMRIALELAKENPVYEGLATKFFQHYVYVAAAMKNMGGRDYQLCGTRRTGSSTTCCATPTDGAASSGSGRWSGLIPLFAVERLEDDWIEPFTEFRAQLSTGS